MSEPVRPRVRDLAAATPAHRDRYVDLLRAVSICMVVVGHWVVGTFTITDEAIAPANLLTVAPWTHPFTWLFQVMPVFFLVGGFANAASLAAQRRHGGTVAAWLRQRALRLLRPTAAFLVVMLTARLVALSLGADPTLVARATWAAATPLWFLVVYLAVVAFAPLTVAAQARWGGSVVVVLVAGVVIGDALRVTTGSDAAAAANYLLAWLAVHQAGIAWFHGELPRHAAGSWGLVAGGLAAALLLTGPGPYGVAMVGAAAPPGLTNTAPPTVALLALATAQIGAVLLLRRPAERWLARPRAWTGVVLLNSVILTVFLWHMTALVIAGLALVGTGVYPHPPVASGAWFVLRLPWLALLSVLLAGLVRLMGRWEAPIPSDPQERPSAWAVGSGLGAVLVGMTLLGVTDTAGLAPAVVGIPVVELALVAAGLTVLARAGRRRS